MFDWDDCELLAVAACWKQQISKNLLFQEHERTDFLKNFLMQET